MALKPENVELRNKIMAGIHKAVKKLVIESAEKNQQLVIADKDGNVPLVDAKELLKTVTEN